MSTQTNTENLFQNLFQFYFDEAEKMTPVLKQGIDDWFAVYNKIFTETMRLQSGFIKKLTGNNESAAFADQAKNLGEELIKTQKDVSTGLVDVGMKGIKSLKDIVKKTKP